MFVYLCVCVCVFKALPENSIYHQGGLGWDDQAAAFTLWSVMCESRSHATHTHTHRYAHIFTDPNYTTPTHMCMQSYALPHTQTKALILVGQVQWRLANSKHLFTSNLLRLLINQTPSVNAATSFCGNFVIFLPFPFLNTHLKQVFNLNLIIITCL